jgi:lysine 2,3-aminomutase
MDIHEVTLPHLLNCIQEENPVITGYLLDDTLDDRALVVRLQTHYTEIMKRDFPEAWSYYTQEKSDYESFFALTWRSFAFIRVMDLLDHEGQSFEDGNLQGETVISQPVSLLRKLLRGEPCEANIDFVLDVLHLLRQLNGREVQNLPSRNTVYEWTERHPSGLDPEVVAWRAKNKDRIVRLLVERIREESTAARASKIYHFKGELTDAEARKQVLTWWREDRFHLRFAVRSADEVNRYLDNSVDEQTMQIMHAAEERGIPVFATPYFLSLIDTRPREQREHPFADEALRSYLFYSQDLVDEFGSIHAWEKEDVVEPGKPNEAGWILPSHNIHRRYPNVAIFIPDTMGRACGGLCAYCQRMYDFQNGRFNFDLDKLRPKKTWTEVLHESMVYFRTDPFLEDILITGGDALMSSVSSLKKILDAVLHMAQNKKLDNEQRPAEQKLAEFRRVRLGTKLPIYLPQRVTKELVDVLKTFREQAKEVGITQCVIQTHFSSAMEVSVDSAKAVRRLLDAGWAVTNQEVFTVAASRRGHTAKLRQVLNDIGVLPYYTFTVKGFKENRELFANNPRSMQEQIEEKSMGRVDYRYHSTLRSFISDAKHMVEHIDSIRDADEIPFLATDRNTINLPGVGKSNTYRTIGITNDGRRILEFEFDHTRPHSPVIEEMGSVVIIESKSVAEYLRQLTEMGEDPDEYASIWGYSAGRLEPRSPVFEGSVV